MLQSITTKLRNQPENQIDALICSLYCNIALCQSNLGDAEKAFKSLNTISAPVAADSKTYHFVYASIIIQHTLSSQYDVAEQHLDRALEIDDAYLQAIHRLNDVHEDAAISLAKIILDDTFRVWRRGTYYRETAKNYDDSQALEKATRILHYVRTVLAGIKEIFPNDAEKWQQYTELKSIVLREVKEKT